MDYLIHNGRHQYYLEPDESRSHPHALFNLRGYATLFSAKASSWPHIFRNYEKNYFKLAMAYRNPVLEP